MKAITKLHAFVLKLSLKACSSHSYIKEQSFILQNAKLMTILRCYHVTYNVHTLMYNNYVLVRYYVCRVGVKVRVRVKGVKRIPLDARRDRYAIEEIFTSANMTMTELDK